MNKCILIINKMSLPVVFLLPMKILLIFIIILLVDINSIDINVKTSGVFKNCSDTCFIENNGTIVKWGIATINNSLSGLEFIGKLVELNTDNSPKIIGNLIHNNYPITGVVPNLIDLNISISSELNITNIPFTLQINETTNKELNETICPYKDNPEWFGLFNNNSLCCPYLTIEEPCSDRIKFITPFNLEYSFVINETEYTLYIDGIKNHNNHTVDSFITEENKSTIGEIVARLIAICADNATCKEINECIISECLDGFCQYNSSILNGEECKKKIPMNYNDKCYDTYCLNGECIIDTESFNEVLCDLPIPRKLNTECYDSRCLNGLCKINTELYNNLTCNLNTNYDQKCYNSKCLDGSCEINLINNITCKKEHLDTNLHSKCYKTVCLNGFCELDTLSFNNNICIVDDCQGNCINGTCIGNCINNNDDDDDDINLLPLLSLLSLLCYLPLICCCLLLPLLIIPIIILINKKLSNSVAVSTGEEILKQALNNPIYENKNIEGENPLYEL